MNEFNSLKRASKFFLFAQGISITIGFVFSIMLSFIEILIVFKTLNFFTNDFENIIFCILFMIYFQIRFVWYILNDKFVHGFETTKAFEQSYRSFYEHIVFESSKHIFPLSALIAHFRCLYEIYFRIF